MPLLADGTGRRPAVTGTWPARSASCKGRLRRGASWNNPSVRESAYRGQSLPARAVNMNVGAYPFGRFLACMAAAPGRCYVAGTNPQPRADNRRAGA